jgi:hypothetical protein
MSTPGSVPKLNSASCAPRPVPLIFTTFFLRFFSLCLFSIFFNLFSIDLSKYKRSTLSAMSFNASLLAKRIFLAAITFTTGVFIIASVV